MSCFSFFFWECEYFMLELKRASDTAKTPTMDEISPVEIRRIDKNWLLNYAWLFPYLNRKKKGVAP